MTASPSRAWTLAARLQGPYYVVTSVWPLVHMASFLRVTGPKRDLWLVRTVAVVMGAIGAGLLAASGPRGVPPAAAVSGAVAAAGVAAVDLSPGPPRSISRLYLLDAALQLTALALWIAGAAGPAGRRDPRAPFSRGA